MDPLSPRPKPGKRSPAETSWATSRRRRSSARKSWFPPPSPAALTSIRGGDYTVEDTVAVITDEKGREHPVTLMQKWPCARAVPTRGKLSPEMPLVTGSGSSTRCSPSPRRASPLCPAPSVPGKPWCSTSWPSGRTRTSWSTSDAGSAAMR